MMENDGFLRRGQHVVGALVRSHVRAVRYERRKILRQAVSLLQEEQAGRQPGRGTSGPGTAAGEGVRPPGQRSEGSGARGGWGLCARG